MVELIHISDIHIGSEFQAECMENVISYIDKISPDVVVCTGDIVHNGRKAQYQVALPYLNRIKEFAPFLAVPGNHCAKSSGLIFFERYVGPRRSTMNLEDKDTTIVGLCSAKEDLSYGEVGDEQLDWLGRQFHKPLENRIIALHHHLIPPPFSGKKFTTVRDAGEILEFVQLFDVDIVLVGHRHVPHAYVIPPTTFVYGGTATSDKMRADEGPCFNHITLENDDLEVYVVDSVTLEEKLLLTRKKGKTEFIRRRKTRIEHLLNSQVWDD